MGVNRKRVAWMSAQQSPLSELLLGRIKDPHDQGHADEDSESIGIRPTAGQIASAARQFKYDRADPSIERACLRPSEAAA